MRADAQARDCTALGIALFGKTSDDPHRQLLAPHPEIPSGFDLADFRALRKEYSRNCRCSGQSCSGQSLAWAINGMGGGHLRR
jgi:hypothetical protein